MSADTFLANALDGRAHYLDWGPFLISVANLLVIGVIIGLFILAILLPFPGSRSRS